ncbi:MAG: YcxB family protein [Suipraeoptans sp.]
MKNTYSSLAGMVNVVFTAAMILLTYRFGMQVNGLVFVLLIIGCVLFPVIQPVCIYKKAKKKVSEIPGDMQIAISDKGISVYGDESKTEIPYKKFVKVVRDSQMVILMLSTGAGYMLSNRTLGEQKEEVYEYIRIRTE